MISAVGTFEEGALAQKYGAAHVIHKSRIEDEIDALYNLIEQANKEFHSNMKLLQEVYDIRSQENPNGDSENKLQNILANPKGDPFVKSEAYDTLLQFQSNQIQSDAQDQAANLAGNEQATIDEAVNQLTEILPFFKSLDEQSKESLKTAEFLYLQQERDSDAVDFSRNIGFSYCFAVENEVKITIKSKLKRFLGSNDNYKLINEFIDSKRRQLDIFFPSIPTTVITSSRYGNNY